MKHLLLLHGAIGAKDQLQPLAAKLRDKFNVHTLSFSGHGGQVMPGSFSIELFAEDVLNYLDAQHIERINIFGYSMGGYVALFLAKHHPERIEKVFTLATKFHWTPEIAQKEIKMLDPEKIAEKLPAFAEALKNRHAPNDWAVVLEKTKEMMIRLGEHNTMTLEDYEEIRQEVMIAVGDQDTMVTQEETREVCGRLRNGKFLLMENTPHPLEKTDEEVLSSRLSLFF